MEAGAESVVAYVTHGVFSGGAVARVASSALEMLHTTDSILPTEAVNVAKNIHRLTIAPLIAEAMRRISDESSVSSLFD
jgi:ribose-phosphate pyrophosphokinase